MFNQPHEVNMPSHIAPPGKRGAHPSRFITIELFAQAVGYTPKAVRRKIEAGVWREGLEYLRAPDGRVLILIDGFENWVQK